MARSLPVELLAPLVFVSHALCILSREPFIFVEVRRRVMCVC